MIIIDQIFTHGSGGTGDDTVPPGITGLDWCHLVSTTSLVELTAFLTLNLLTIGQPITNVRTPLLGSEQTYAGLDATMRAAAITAGASPNRIPYVRSNGFDAPASGPPYWEP
ncbi:MAG TPA: hypothetical protein VLN57_21250 [Xanthobacteraceae bacterium]|nr:hypothetical protein [Xanthobacteraceae bacterium]